MRRVDLHAIKAGQFALQGSLGEASNNLGKRTACGLARKATHTALSRDQQGLRNPRRQPRRLATYAHLLNLGHRQRPRCSKGHLGQVESDVTGSRRVVVHHLRALAPAVGQLNKDLAIRLGVTRGRPVRKQFPRGRAQLAFYRHVVWPFHVPGGCTPANERQVRRQCTQCDSNARPASVAFQQATDRRSTCTFPVMRRPLPPSDHNRYLMGTTKPAQQADGQQREGEGRGEGLRSGRGLKREAVTLALQRGRYGPQQRLLYNNDSQLAKLGRRLVQTAPQTLCHCRLGETVGKGHTAPEFQWRGDCDACFRGSVRVSHLGGRTKRPTEKMPLVSDGSGRLPLAVS